MTQEQICVLTESQNGMILWNPSDHHVTTTLLLYTRGPQGSEKAGLFRKFFSELEGQCHEVLALHLQWSAAGAYPMVPILAGSCWSSRLRSFTYKMLIKDPCSNMVLFLQGGTGGVRGCFTAREEL